MRGVDRSASYAGADLTNARRIAALLVLLATVLTLAYAPMSPPTEMIGWAGGAVLAVWTVVALLTVRWLAKSADGVTFNRLYVISWCGLATVVLLEWLAGGHSSYAALFMLWLGSGVGVHPPRRAAPYLIAVLVATALPLVYDGWDSTTAQAIATYDLLWVAIGLVLLVLIARIRSQRVRMQTVEQTARADAEIAAKRVRDLQQVTDAALAQMPLDELLGELLERISNVLDLDAAAILLTDEQGSALTVRAARGVPSVDDDGQPLRIAVGDGCAGRVAAERRTVLLRDVSDARDLDPPFRETRVRALAGVPLIASDRVIGVIEVGSEERDSFSPHDVRLLALAADR